MNLEKSSLNQFMIRLLLFVKNIYKFAGNIVFGVIIGWMLMSIMNYDRFYWNQIFGVFTLIFFLSLILKFLISTQRLEIVPVVKSEESFLNRLRYAYGWFNWKIQITLGFALSTFLVRPEMAFLVKPDYKLYPVDGFAERVYLYDMYSSYSWYMFGSTLLLFFGLMAFAYAFRSVLEDKVFQNKSLLKKEYTLYQRSILNKIFKKGNKKTNIPFDLKVLYLKPEYVDKFKVADLKITTEQTESSNLRLHRIEFVLEDKVTGMLLKKLTSPLWEKSIMVRKISIHSLTRKPYYLELNQLKNPKISLKQIKIMIKKLKKIQKKNLKIFIQKSKQKFLFLKLKIESLIKNIQQKEKIQKNVNIIKINKRKNIDKQKGGTMYCPF